MPHRVLQELRELGARGALWRIGWEARTRAGLAGRFLRKPTLQPAHELRRDWLARVPFADPPSVEEAMRDRIPAEALEALRDEARRSMRGDLLCFGRWRAEFGDPIDWHLNPTTRERWDDRAYWSQALRDEARVGDVKLTWEAGRFPQAYRMARAGVFFPEDAPELAHALAAQITSFVEANPFQVGVHWHSGQEIAFRHMAWIFAARVMFAPAGAFARVEPILAEQFLLGASHGDAIIEYARRAVYNNHLLSEALLLYATGILFPHAREAARWRRKGRALLIEGAERQFYPDGGYIQQSHTYQRVALQDLLWAVVFARAWGEQPDATWIRAVERSIDFLYAQQNPYDGRLPNYGANDGSQPSIWASCDYTDFRPILQCASVGMRGERLYEPGPWDEPAAWLWGARSLDVPLRSRPRKSVSFSPTGYHVLRGDRADCFATFRCGSVIDCFSQIDMLHTDVWWRGDNVLCDPGSYLYNGKKEWHGHFYETASHNTVTVDGADQMVHHRRFKNLFWTKAQTVRFEARERVKWVEGEHSGYRRDPYRVAHRRTVLMAGDDVWVVVDRLDGDGEHTARLHWLGAPGDWTYDVATARLALVRPEGQFEVKTLDASGAPLPGNVVAGAEAPPRGWLSRYYGEKVPAPSLAVERRARLPLVFVSVLSGGAAGVLVANGLWLVTAAGTSLSFALERGEVRDVEVRSSAA